MHKIRLQHATEIRTLWSRNNTSLSWGGRGKNKKEARVLHKKWQERNIERGPLTEFRRKALLDPITSQSVLFAAIVPCEASVTKGIATHVACFV